MINAETPVQHNELLTYKGDLDDSIIERDKTLNITQT